MYIHVLITYIHLVMAAIFTLIVLVQFIIVSRKQNNVINNYFYVILP